MGRFARVADAKVFGKGQYFACLSAKYRVRVTECRAQESRQGDLAFIVEVEVIALISKPVETKDAEGRTLAAPGESRCWYVNLENDAGPPDMQAFVGLVCGEDLDGMSKDEREELCEYVVGEEQPVAGMELILETFNRPTKKGNPFTIHKWSNAG